MRERWSLDFGTPVSGPGCQPRFSREVGYNAPGIWLQLKRYGSFRSDPDVWIGDHLRCLDRRFGSLDPNL